MDNCPFSEYGTRAPGSYLSTFIRGDHHVTGIQNEIILVLKQKLDSKTKHSFGIFKAGTFKGIGF